MSRISLLLFFLTTFITPQEISRVTLIEDENSYTVPSYNYQGTIYVSLKHFAESLNLSGGLSVSENAIEIDLKNFVLKSVCKNYF